jgi:hypothetical protein
MQGSHRVSRIRQRFARALVCSSVTLVTACSGTSEAPSPNARREQPFGTVGLKLQPVAGITLSTVHYVVTQGSATVVEGDLPTPGTGDTFSFGIPLPAGTGYAISLSSVSAEAGDDITCTGSFGSFDVTPNTSTQFSMSLTCVDNSNGQALSNVDVETEACPRLAVDYAVALPYRGAVDWTSIAVLSSAHDLDQPSAVITYAWSIVESAHAAVGSFNPANAQNSEFVCASHGEISVQVTASNGECSKSLETFISCANIDRCGNGVFEPEFETCDIALDPTCPADCTRVCGDGIVESGEECDLVPQNPALCTTDTCQIVIDEMAQR